MRSLAFLAFLVPAVIVACSSDDDGRDCTLLACVQGVDIAFTETKAGAYALEIAVDGVASTCTVTLPMAASTTTTPLCTSTDVQLTVSGAALPAAQQSIGGLRVTRTDARSITVRVARDGAPIREATFAPGYVVSPGPNGPGCEPAQCTRAAFTLP